MSTTNSPRESGEQGPPAIVRTQPRGWWRRNGLWFVPTLLLAVIVVGGAAGYWALFLRIYNLEVCQTAMRTIEADKQLRETLGEPIETVKWPSRSAAPNARVEERETDVRWHVQGPKGGAEVHAHARLMQGKWEIDTLEVNGKRVTMAGDSEADAKPFTAAESSPQKPDDHTPPPEINLPVPPVDGPEK